MSVDLILSHASELINHYGEHDFSKIPDYRTYLRQRIDEIFAQYPLEHVHTDIRRSISEYNGGDFSIQQFEVYSSGIPLGNHFHKKSRQTQQPEEDTKIVHPVSEIFLFDQGSGVLLLQEITSERAGKTLKRSEVKRQFIGKDSIIVMSPFQAHTLFLDPGTKFRGFRPYPFDRDDMDMNPHKLELPK